MVFKILNLFSGSAHASVAQSSMCLLHHTPHPPLPVCHLLSSYSASGSCEYSSRTLQTAPLRLSIGQVSHHTSFARPLCQPQQPPHPWVECHHVQEPCFPVQLRRSPHGDDRTVVKLRSVSKKPQHYHPSSITVDHPLSSAASCAAQRQCPCVSGVCARLSDHHALRPQAWTEFGNPRPCPGARIVTQTLNP